MNLYAHDCSYMRTEYAREKMIEQYNDEAKAKEKAIDDDQQEGNEYKKSIPGSAHRTTTDGYGEV